MLWIEPIRRYIQYAIVHQYYQNIVPKTKKKMCMKISLFSAELNWFRMRTTQFRLLLHRMMFALILVVDCFVCLFEPSRAHTHRLHQTLYTQKRGELRLLFFLHTSSLLLFFFLIFSIFYILPTGIERIELPHQTHGSLTLNSEHTYNV